MEEKKEKRWRVAAFPNENGFCCFHIRRTDVIKVNPRETRRVSLMWDTKAGKFVKSSEVVRFNNLSDADKKEVMRQMREILRLGLPKLPSINWPDEDLV